MLYQGNIISARLELEDSVYTRPGNPNLPLAAREVTDTARTINGKIKIERINGFPETELITTRRDTLGRDLEESFLSAGRFEIVGVFNTDTDINPNNRFQFALMKFFIDGMQDDEWNYFQVLSITYLKPRQVRLELSALQPQASN